MITNNRPAYIMGYYHDYGRIESYLITAIKNNKIKIVYQVWDMYYSPTWHKVYFTKMGYPYIKCRKRKLTLTNFRMRNIEFLQDMSPKPQLVMYSKY